MAEATKDYNEQLRDGIIKPQKSLESLLHVMNSVYLPRIASNNTWPATVKKEFTGQVNKFMAQLTEAAYHSKGTTMLYFPMEDVSDPIKAAADKDLVQRLETTVIHWTRQIKEVVNHHGSAEEADSSGPLDEIAFWRDRTVDLSGISEQLNREGIRQVVAVLETSKSNYLDPFAKLSEMIQQGSTEADDNLKYLTVLDKPCRDLGNSTPATMGTLLPLIMNCVRMIWAQSSYYNTEDRLCGLLRKVSNAVIRRCCETIDLNDIFMGSVQRVMEVLRESVNCGMEWKAVFFRIAKCVEREANATGSDRLWNFDPASVFAQVDAFVQRCRDLLEACEGQIQFARKTEDGQAPLPIFGGPRGPEIIKNLLGIEESFAVHLSALKNVGYDILDVKATRWHDDFSAFKSGVKDLEVMMQNVITTSFETVSTIEGGVDLLTAWKNIATRDAVIRCVETKTVDLYSLFGRTVKQLRHQFEVLRKTPSLLLDEPKFSGSALWAGGILGRVQSMWASLRSSGLPIPQRDLEEAKVYYDSMTFTVGEFIHKQNMDWVSELPSLDQNQLQSRLDNPLMLRVGPQEEDASALMQHHEKAVKSRLVGKTDTGHLESNFDKLLIRLFNEVHCWEKFQGREPIPSGAHNIAAQRENLRVLREYVLLVVRDYNTILDELLPEERKLFSEHIHRLDRRIQPGLNKLTWSSKGVVEWYVKECRRHCNETHDVVKQFKRGKSRLQYKCRMIANTSLLHSERNAVFTEEQFARKQEEHRNRVKAQLEEAHRDIIDTLKSMYGHFEGHPPSVQDQWDLFVKKADLLLETSLRTTVKKSLQELSRAVNGDLKSDPTPLFRIFVILEGAHVEFNPSMGLLTQLMNSVCQEMLVVMRDMGRLGALLRDELEGYRNSLLAKLEMIHQNEIAKAVEAGAEPPEKRSLESGDPSGFFQLLSDDEDILKVVVQVMTGMSTSAAELEKYLSYWHKYRPLWEMDKNTFIRRYAKQNRPLMQYEVDITRYRDQQVDIQAEELSTTINFIKVDCSLLKASLVTHSSEWQGKLTGLLNQNARAELMDLTTMFSENTVKLQAKPLDLPHLRESLELLRHLTENSDATEARFEPLEAMYHTLNSFSVQIPEDEVEMLNLLRQRWAAFAQVMVEARTMLDKSKTSMRANLQQALMEFGGAVSEMKKSALRSLPYGSSFSQEEAEKVIADFTVRIEEARMREKGLRPGMQIFNIEASDYKELKDVEKDLAQLKDIWGLTSEWTDQWNSWKVGRFHSLDVKEMENSAALFNKRLGKMRDIKRWGVWQSMREEVDKFRQTMPLILDLKNPAMRPRHWAQLRQEMNKVFDPHSEDFTLEMAFSLGLHDHSAFISELSGNANKELAIESALAEIERKWGEIAVDVAVYKDSYHKIRTTEDLFQELEDSQVSLSTMKASRFYVAFEKSINHWETALGQVSEVIEIALQVQRQWMYLESIFLGSEDIRKQLPKEAALFDVVNDNYREIMAQMYKENKALTACSREGLLDRLNTMDSQLDEIQKSLDAYLETKRQLFPRFYFLSNDDLLEILGQSRDPSQVQKHIKKCFEGIKVLDLIAPGKQGNKYHEAMGMIAPDGEHVVFEKKVLVHGAVELWLIEIEKMMIRTVAMVMMESLKAVKGRKEKWIKEFPGQLLITTGMIMFTNDVTRQLKQLEKGKKNALRIQKKRQVSYLNKLADLVRQPLDKVVRKKLVALITIEIHNRDILEKLKTGCTGEDDFTWLSQLRLYFDRDGGDYGNIIVRQTNCELTFGYEYQGNNGRLVVTPLTDRCVLTLTTALHLQRGGSPMGPAGTGKTETVKDLGKNLAKYVVVFNCSDGLDYKSVGRMFSGLVQSGGWGCFDEFNRIEIEVLSVVAMQILAIMSAIRERRTTFDFMGVMIKCNWNCGIFITMNPGYAGRTELPDNLKSLFRPVAMMVPDMALIAEVMLQAEGFKEARLLAKKTVTLYSLMTQQLSKQDHYDYGLRSLRGVLVCAGALKRSDPSVAEEMIVLRAIRDMNMPKFIKADADLFMLLLGDLFPSLDLPPFEGGDLGETIEEELAKEKLQKHPVIVQKCIELRDSKATRHCNMLVGRTLGGKSTVWKMLVRARTTLAKAGSKEYLPVKTQIINPKSISMNELYGAYDLQTMEWTDGILSCVFRTFAQDEKAEEKWLILDGPVDTLWIESMNTVMDDNKTLTLINGDRISMSQYMSLLFEVQDLAVASPATVSRAGMVYVDVADLGWRPYVKSWIQRSFDQESVQAFFEQLFEKYVAPVLEFKRRNIKELVEMTDFNAVISLCNLFTCICTPQNGLDMKDSGNEGFFTFVEKWFAFCMVWSICAAADEAGRIRLDSFLRDVEAQFPPMNTVYEYYVDPSTRDFKAWTERVGKGYRPPRDLPFFKIIVPTVDTVRNAFVIRTLVMEKLHVLCVGGTGTGKTILGEQLLEGLPETHSKLIVNMSAATKSKTTQNCIEGAMEKRAKDKMGPAGGKKLVTFVDDLNMPKKDTFGSQPPLELLRQWVDYSGWYDRKKQQWRFILDMQLVCAMGPPGGGRTVISERFQSRFNTINFTFPAESQLRWIFECILNPKLAEFNDEVKPMVGPLVQATVNLYNVMTKQFLPTPQKCHYLFNMRDMAKVVQGLLQADKSFLDTAESMTRLWVHECLRVFGDRLTNELDIEKFHDALDIQLSECFNGTSIKKLCGDLEEPAQGPIFIDFLSEPVGDLPAAYVESLDRKHLKAHLNEALEDYNIEPGFIPMEIVMFRDAMSHVCRVHRVLKQPRGNAMLVGVGGSGRQSLTRLASFVAEYSVFQIEITKNYRSLEFHEDLKTLYLQTGVENKQSVFLFVDTQIKEESFLEDINNVLSSGEVPNLFGKDDLVAVYDGLRPVAKEKGIPETADCLWELFIQRVRDNLHVVLCMSPVGDGFRNRCRMYPGLVNCTTIDWFHPWPEDALMEVAMYFLEENRSMEAELKPRVSNVFATAHKAVEQASDKMLVELKRHNYVTPSNYLELVRNYRSLLDEKQQELGDAASKLKNGLAKLDESRKQVEEMSIELEHKKEFVAQKQKDCEDLLVVIVSERRVADEQQKQVEADSTRISKEEAECKEIADEATADLEKAIPALENAMMEVDKLDKSAISEVKAYQKPPDDVQMVLSAVMILFGQKTDWASSKRKLGEANFLSQIKSFDKDSVTNTTLTKIRKYTKRKEFVPEEVAKKSFAAAALCTWVCAIEIFAVVYREVAPKKARLKSATESLRVKQEALRRAKEKLQEVTDKVEKLRKQYEDSVSEKNALRQAAEELEAKLARADKLVTGLSGERSRWEGSIADLETQIEHLIGDTLVASAFLSYAGPFDTIYRAGLVDSWMAKVKLTELPFTEDFKFGDFLAKPTDVRDWNIQGLPADAFSTENGVVVTRGRLWPLMIDPQGQANRWVKNMEGAELKVADLKQKDFLRELENALQFGLPYLLQDVLEELDPALEPVLSKSVIKIGNREVIKLGDKELDYSPDFRFYITTKLANPHYTPEVSTKTTIVNFAVKEEGLEAQLLGIVVQKEEPKLEQQKSELVVAVAAGKKKLVNLENEILRLLSEAKGSLLDNEELVVSLQQSKSTSEEVTQSLRISEETEKKIDTARGGYRPVSVRSAMLFFVLNDLGQVDPMYQFSLDAYVDLFVMSIEQSRGKEPQEELVERISAINAYHTLAVYKYACRGLFERHKLLLSLQICIRKMQHEGKIDKRTYDFFLRGGLVMDRSDQRMNPTDWLDALAWDNITELDKLPNFAGIANSFDQMREWRGWYMSNEPENMPLPGEWDGRLGELQRAVLVRSLRPDRVIFTVTKFVSNNLGPTFVDPPAFDLKAIFESSTAKMPLIFVLSPGVDPTKQVFALGESLGVHVDNCALGQGQAPVATAMIQKGLESGNWVFLANCHLSISWMPTLEKIIENYCTGSTPPHPDFRLWLSSDPHPKFPISVLQRGVKMTTEPPRGLKANLLRLYNLVSEQEFSRCTQRSKYKKLLFSLCWFHAVLLERRKFKALGWNIPYDFNNSDFSICENILAMYLDTYSETPWPAIRYLVAEANYGGRITDDWDRRLCNVYVAQFFRPEALATTCYPLSERSEYYIPEDGELESYRTYVKHLPMNDPPAAFGQHPNADIQSQIEDTKALLDTVISLQPRVVSAVGESNDEKVLRIAADLKERTPAPFDILELKKTLLSRPDPEPLKSVLRQEAERYNKLLVAMGATLVALHKGIQGLVVITPELEEIYDSLLGGKVPQSWSFCYPSLKPLGSWIRDLQLRCSQLTTWIDLGVPKVFWLSGFTYPTGFLTALFQTSARKNGVAIDSLSWEFPVLNQEESTITQHPKEGAYIKGMFLEGAAWDHEHNALCEPAAMELFCPMPIVHFKPVDSRKRLAKGYYICPLYLYPVRTGTRERPSFMVEVHLKVGNMDSDYWTKRGTALLLSLAS